MTSNICSDVVDGEDGSGASAANRMTFCCVRPIPDEYGKYTLSEVAVDLRGMGREKRCIVNSGSHYLCCTETRAYT
jgi:hypothetical protein